MKQRPRRYFTEADKELMWDRWQAGDFLHEIARLFDWGHSSGFCINSPRGLLFVCLK